MPKIDVIVRARFSSAGPYCNTKRDASSPKCRWTPVKKFSWQSPAAAFQKPNAIPWLIYDAFVLFLCSNPKITSKQLSATKWTKKCKLLRRNARLITDKIAKVVSAVNMSRFKCLQVVKSASSMCKIDWLAVEPFDPIMTRDRNFSEMAAYYVSIVRATPLNKTNSPFSAF